MNEEERKKEMKRKLKMLYYNSLFYVHMLHMFVAELSVLLTMVF